MSLERHNVPGHIAWNLARAKAWCLLIHEEASLSLEVATLHSTAVSGHSGGQLDSRLFRP